MAASDLPVAILATATDIVLHWRFDAQTVVTETLLRGY